MLEDIGLCSQHRLSLFLWILIRYKIYGGNAIDCDISLS
jgi:hypothetical protein